MEEAPMIRAIRPLLIVCLAVSALAFGSAGCAQLKAKAPGSEVGKPTTANSSGFLQMPFLTTLSEEEARETLAESGMTGTIKVEYVECNDKGITSGHVCNTYPAGGAQTTTTSETVLWVTQ
jgi:hypothetical protein